jgi:hypothetical protein
MRIGVGLVKTAVNFRIHKRWEISGLAERRLLSASQKGLCCTKLASYKSCCSKLERRERTGDKDSWAETRNGKSLHSAVG